MFRYRTVAQRAESTLWQADGVYSRNEGKEKKGKKKVKQSLYRPGVAQRAPGS